jgi:hypothetical protein
MTRIEINKLVRRARQEAKASKRWNLVILVMLLMLTVYIIIGIKVCGN